MKLAEMRPAIGTPAHHTGYCAELVCSNSFRAAALTNAVGLLKEEMRRLGSVIMECADAHRVPAGGALAVDRNGYAAAVTEKPFILKMISIIPHWKIKDIRKKKAW